MKSVIYICLSILLAICISCNFQEAPIIENEAYLFYKNNEDEINNIICEKVLGKVDRIANKTQTKLLGGTNQELYVWALCIYNPDKNGIESSTFLPVKVSYSDNAILTVEFPRDGNLYSEDLKKLFPKSVNSYYLNDIDKYNKIVEELQIQSSVVEK